MRIKQLPMFDPVEIHLTKGYVALVDPMDADLSMMLWQGRGPNKRSNTRYAQISRSRQKLVLLMHRVVMERVLGRALLKTETVDHINGNGLDNRRSNLRLALASENNRNVGRNKNNTSGYKGVSFFNATKGNKRWRAQIKVDKKEIHLGLFETPEAAYAAYCEAAKRLHGEFARLE